MHQLSLPFSQDSKATISLEIKVEMLEMERNVEKKGINLDLGC